MNQPNAMMNGNHHPQQPQQSHTQIETQEILHTNVPFDHHHHHHTLSAANSYGNLTDDFHQSFDYILEIEYMISYWTFNLVKLKQKKYWKTFVIFNRINSVSNDTLKFDE